MVHLTIVIQNVEGNKTIHKVTFIIAINYEFTFGLELDTSIRIKCNTRMGVILGSRVCQEVPFEDEFDLIEVKGRGVNEQVNFGVYIRILDKYEIEVFTMQE